MILLDTHIWLRWLLPTNPLPNSLVLQIEKANTIFISSMSCWEVVMLEQRQRIELPLPTEEWLKEATLVLILKYYRLLAIFLILLECFPNIIKTQLIVLSLQLRFVMI